MRILIIGVNHQIQPAEIRSWGSDGKPQEFERQQKEAFGQLVRGKIQEVAAKYVAEEARHGEETVTQRVCGQQNCRYENIEMTPEERQDRNIPPGYNDDLPDISESDKARCNREREEYMAAKAVADAGDADSIIVVSGSAHREPLANLFRASGHEVSATDLSQQEWYVDNWQNHIMYNL